MTKTLAGRCTGNPIMRPVLDLTPADETARDAAGWSKHNHPRRGTTGKPGAYFLPVPCHFSSTDGAEYAKHVREVHGAKLESKSQLPGKGFRVPAKSAGEKLALGKSVRIVTAAGELIGQVWSEADSTLIGARKGSAFFAVADGRTFTFEIDTKRPGLECRGFEYLAGGHQGDRVTVHMVRGPVAEMTLVDETAAPVVVPDVVVTAAPVDIVAEAIESGRMVVVNVDTGAAYVAPVGATLPDPADVGPVAPETVPAPMPRMTRAARKATRREIAATMRAAGIRPEGEAWREACAAAGLVTSESVHA